MFVLVSKRPLTLEEKIARVQQKLREKAEQRKRQYDQDIKLRFGKKNGKSKSENSQEIIKPSMEEIEAQIISEPVAESSLKAPVHHEHELRDALEVEIYHKPSDDSKTKDQEIEGFKMTEKKEAKEIKETIFDESRATEEQDSENQAPKEYPVTTSNNLAVSETDGIKNKENSSSMDENVIENSVLIRKPRSVEDITDIAEDNEEEIHKKVEQKKALVVETQSAETVTLNQIEEKEDLDDKSHDNFDHTQAVVNESIIKSENNDQEVSNRKELENVIDISEVVPLKNEIQNSNLNEVTSEIKVTEVEREQNEVKDPETNSIVVDNVDNMEESEENKNMDMMVIEEKFKTTAKTTSDENINDERNIEQNNANENVADNFDKLEVQANEKPHEHHESLSSTKVDNSAENYGSSGITKLKTEVRNETIMESKEADQYNDDESGTVGFPLNQDVEGSIKVKQECLEPCTDKELEDISASIHINNSDGTISEHRVLVVEPDDIEDDNTPVPQQNVENDIDHREQKVNEDNLTDTPVDVANEDSDKKFLSAFEADSETPDTDQLSKYIEQTIHERSKRNLENISEGIETTSNATDVGKSNNETISLSKFSSMDDSVPEDGNDNVANEINTNIKSINNTNTSAMDLETAAVTIQKVFRTFLFKSRASTFEDSVNDDNNLTDEDTEKVCIF